MKKMNDMELSHRQGLTVKYVCMLICSIGLFAHWPALLSDSVMWDDWIVISWINSTRLDWIYNFFHSYGLTPYCFVFFPWVLLLKNPIVAELIAKYILLFGVIGNALLIFLISKKVTHGSILFSAFAGIAAVVFPALSGEGFHMTALSYYFFIPLFFTGILLFIEVSSSEKYHPVKRGVALTVFFLSFSLNSLLVMFYALMPAIFYASLNNKRYQSKFLFEKIKVFTIYHLDFFTIPLIFWAIKSIFMPRAGIYASYNQIGFDWWRILKSSGQLIPNILQTTLFVPFSIPFVLLAASVVFLIAMKYSKKIVLCFENCTGSTKDQLGIMLGLGFLVLFGAALPYYLIGRLSFRSFGFVSRDNILFPLPVGWITAALLCMLLKLPSYLKRIENKRYVFLGQRIIISLFLVVLFSQAISNWRNHLDWQAHYVYYRSAMEKIVNDKLVTEASIIQMNDKIPGGRTLQEGKYPTSIWSEILSAAFKKTARLVIPYSPDNGKFFTKEEIHQRLEDTQVDFMLREINLDGQQIGLTVGIVNANESPIFLALEYWKIRFLNSIELPKFLDSLTYIQSKKIEAVSL